MKNLQQHSILPLLFLLLCRTGTAQLSDTVLVNELNQQARLLLNENKYEASLKTVGEAERLASDIKWDSGLLKVYALKSSIQNVYNKHYDAIATGLKGLDLAKKLKNSYYQVLFYRSLANNNDMLDNYQDAIPYYQKCIDQGGKTPAAKLTLGHCYVEMGDAFRLHLKKAADALELIEKGIAIYKEVDSSTLGYAYDYQGEALTDLKRYDEAEKTFDKSLSIYTANGEEYLIPELLFHTANMYLAKKDFPKAIETANEGVLLSQKMQTIYGESEARKVLYQAYKATGKTALALQEYEQYIVLRDSLTKANIDNRFEQIKTEALLKEQESALKELQLQQQKSTLKTQQFIVVSLILLLLAAFVLANYFRRLNKKMQVKNQRISEALLSGQATERQRLSREIRDQIGANISSVLWTLDLLETSNLSDEFRKTLVSLKSNLSQTYDKVNLLSKNIIPDELESVGLSESLRKLFKKYRDTEQATFELILPENFKGTEPKIEFEIYNIIMELLQLCRKFNCKEATFTIRPTGQRISLSFEANDKGNICKSDDLLLQQIAIRVESLNGKMSSEDEGHSAIEISFRIPN